MGDWNLNFVADRLQQAAFDPTLWSSVLADVSHCAGGAGAVLFSVDKRLPESPASPDLGPMLDDYMKGGWHARDERYRGVPIMLRNGIAVDQDFVNPDEMPRSAYYNDFLGRHKRRWFAGLGLQIEGDLWCISIQRTIAQGPFQADEVQRLKMLLQPLRDAAALTRKIGFARILGMTDALELLGQPSILFDDRGCVLSINGLAEQLVGAMIDVKSQTLAFGDPQSQSKFNAILATAATDALGPPQRSIAVVRDRLGRRHVVRAIGLRGWARYAFTGARALLMFEAAPPSAGEAQSLVRVAFGLTAAESRLAVELSTGISVARAADNLGVTYETARSLLKTIFSKTDTHRQGELVVLLARCVAKKEHFRG